MEKQTDYYLINEFTDCPYCKEQVRTGLMNMINHFQSCKKASNERIRLPLTLEDYKRKLEDCE